MTAKDRISAGKAKMHFDNGILVIDIEPLYKSVMQGLELQDAIQILDQIRNVIGDKLTPVLLDFSNVSFEDTAFRKYFTSVYASRHISALALLVDNNVNIIIANRYMKDENSAITAQFFTRREDAIEWLRGFIV